MTFLSTLVAGLWLRLASAITGDMSFHTTWFTRQHVNGLVSCTMHVMSAYNCSCTNTSLHEERDFVWSTTELITMSAFPP